jgi:hypothetical protein
MICSIILPIAAPRVLRAREKQLVEDRFQNKNKINKKYKQKITPVLIIGLYREFYYALRDHVVVSQPANRRPLRIKCEGETIGERRIIKNRNKKIASVLKIGLNAIFFASVVRVHMGLP